MHDESEARGKEAKGQSAEGMHARRGGEKDSSGERVCDEGAADSISGRLSVVAKSAL